MTSLFVQKLAWLNKRPYHSYSSPSTLTPTQALQPQNLSIASFLRKLMSIYSFKLATPKLLKLVFLE
jgi:hypothetical protein